MQDTTRESLQEKTKAEHKSSIKQTKKGTVMATSASCSRQWC